MRIQVMKAFTFLIPLILLAACEPDGKPATTAAADEAAAMEAAVSSQFPEAAATSCREDIGESEAKKLVERCILMSPATHPPCNVENSCQMIRDEITRSCAMLKPDEQIPEACAAF